VKADIERHGGLVLESATRAASAVPYGPIILSGLIAGALDLTFAFVFYGLQRRTPQQILQGIASAAIGPSSFHLGAVSVALGGFFHFFISISAAAIYYLASRRFPLLTQRPLFSGAVFGVAMYIAMHFVILPLSHVGLRPPRIGDVIGELCSHIFLFGLVIALGISRAQGERKSRLSGPVVKSAAGDF